MREAAGPQGYGDFRGVPTEIRNLKLRRLAEIITRHAISSFVCWIDLQAHVKTYGRESDPLRPYHLVFHTMIAMVVRELVSRGQRERCEIIFDEQGAIGNRAKLWYPLLRSYLDAPEEQAVLPAEPLFKSDEEFLPLQAADMLAWLARKSCRGEQPFPFLDEELRRVPLSEYRGGYTANSMAEDFEVINSLSETERTEILSVHRELLPEKL
jgi:hypothetical protein